jgi:hypothetical protein
MLQWEYMWWRVSALKVVEVNDEKIGNYRTDPSITQELARAGSEGWELVTCPDRELWVFKRPKE